MCMYSSEDGFANDWHLVHLGSRAVGGAGLVMLEASAVIASGRISPQDLGIYKDEHIAGLAQIARFIKEHGASPAIQLAHAGRKASMHRPWEPAGFVPESEGGWSRVVGPSPIAFGQGYLTPIELTVSEIDSIVEAFANGAVRALKAGFEIIELHGAHGYLIHEFLSPISNHRTDAYGGSFENRIRFLIDTVRGVRTVWPSHLPLAVRLSCTDWTPGGWDIAQSVELSRRLKAEGVDLIDCSSGANVSDAKIPVGPGYQVPFAEQIRREAAVATAAVGMITRPDQAQEIISSGKADLVLLARAFLSDPNWALHAARQLGETERTKPPVQYARAF